MKTLSRLLSESQTRISLDRKELDGYVKKFKKNLPVIIQQLIPLLEVYEINGKDEIEQIKNAGAGELTKLAAKYSCDIDVIKEIQNSLKAAKNNIRLLPQMLTQGVFDAMMAGKLSTDDIMLDLSTEKGRGEAAKAYMGTVYKVVQQYVGRSNLTRDDLMSVALEGLNNAINEWSPEPNAQGKVVSFRTMVGYRVQQAILDEISNHSYTLSGGSGYLAKKYGSSMLQAVSLDYWNGDDIDQSKLSALGVEDSPSPEAENDWNAIFKLLAKKFNERDCNVFYRFFGLNGYAKEKSKDIAKSLGKSEGIVRNQYINKMLKFLRDNKQTREILSDLQDLYNESLMKQYWRLSKEMIKEQLINDDTYIFLEESNPWKSKIVFINAHDAAYDALTPKEQDAINVLLTGDFVTLDKNLKKENKLIKKYLTYMYPKININSLSDISLLDKMEEVQDAYQKIVK